jgi:hypothetical protein
MGGASPILLYLCGYVVGSGVKWEWKRWLRQRALREGFVPGRSPKIPSSRWLKLRGGKGLERGEYWDGMAN